ncbi:MAG: hypothetical protein PHR47_04015 [Candidatus Pacebacteria bacterium]|nr:hypothetical protein [Candidatus Paceibacterota bacterium]
MKNKNNQEGFAIYLVLVILAILLSVSFNISNVIITASKMTGNLADGVRAFHAADSGIEASLCSTSEACDGTSTVCDVSTPSTVSGDSNFTYSIGITGTCPDIGTTITSEGKYKTNARRILEVTW